MRNFTENPFTKKLYTLLVFYFLSGFIITALGQGQANVWYMGNGAGIDFNTIPPTQLEDGNAGLITDTGEGVGSICDAAGNLLFYTNGNIVYNRNHVAMPNGTGLNGNGTTTQTGVIVPKIGSTTQYYVFTPSAANNPVTYSIVDMTLDGGLGDVVAGQKNVALLPQGSESAVVIPHDNEVDYWVIFHASISSNYRVFLLTAAGLSGPTTYTVGSFGQATMTMKVNSCFNQISSVFYNSTKVEVVPFNNTTGVVGPGVTATITNFNSAEVYSSEFSPNGRFLYVSQSGLNSQDDISQFDLQAGSNALINSSKRTHTGGSTVRAGDLQLGPDGKIYVPGYTTSPPGYLSVIPNPDVQWAASPPTAVEFEYLKYTYSAKRLGEGLPPVLKNLLTAVKIIYNNACEGGSTQFSFSSGSTPSSAPGSITWDFGDGSPIVQDQLTPSHTYAVANTYTVTLTVIDICGRTRVGTANVIVKPGPQVSVVAGACPNTDITFTGTGANAANYTWSNNSSGIPVIVTGSSYTYNGALPKTIYVQDPTPLATYTTGNSTASQNFGADVGHTYFELYTTVKITSFQVISRISGTANLSIQNAAGTITYWGPTAVSPTAGGQTFTPTPNVTLAPGLYRFFTSNRDICFRNNASTDGGRDVNGVINVTGENSGIKGGSFINIIIELPDPCGIRAYTVIEDCTQPVTLLEFKGVRNGNVSHLTWITSSEKNSSHFIVQRSLDGINYSDIDTVNAAGNSISMNKYSAIDYMPAPGSNYYRLVQYDIDGAAHIYKTVVVNMSGANVLIAPNPFNQNTQIQFSDNINASIIVMDVLGRIVAQYEKEGNENAISVGNDLVAGSYVLRIISEAGVNNFMIIKE